MSPIRRGVKDPPDQLFPGAAFPPPPILFSPILFQRPTSTTCLAHASVGIHYAHFICIVVWPPRLEQLSLTDSCWSYLVSAILPGRTQPPIHITYICSKTPPKTPPKTPRAFLGYDQIQFQLGLVFVRRETPHRPRGKCADRCSKRRTEPFAPRARTRIPDYIHLQTVRGSLVTSDVQAWVSQGNGLDSLSVVREQTCYQRSFEYLL